MDFLIKLVDSEKALRRWYIISLLCNMGIVVTGGIVRVTGSGLGCPTWPHCHPGSFIPHGELGIHEYIEFGNRLLTFVLAAAAAGAFITTHLLRPSKSLQWWLTLSIGIGVALQAGVGGITVLTGLNPWIVGAHLWISIALITLCTWAVATINETATHVGSGRRWLVIATFTATMVCIFLGSLVTGAGPNAGDENVARNGLDILWIARIHSASSWLLTGLSVLCVVTLRRYGAAGRAALALLATVTYQAVIGYIQYFNGLPPVLVVLHMAGLTFATAAGAWLLFATMHEPSEQALEQEAAV